MKNSRAFRKGWALRLAVLVIDSTYFLTVGILGRDPFFSQSSSEHVEKLAPFARKAVGECGQSLERVEALVGPGPFTGLRSGIAFALGLSLAKAIPVKGGGLLLAQKIWDERQGRRMPVLSVNDARRRQAYFQMFDPGGTPSSSMDIASPSRIAFLARSIGAPFDLVGPEGEYFEKLRSALKEEGLEFAAFQRPISGAEWLRCAHESVERSPFPVKPIYLRGADAVPMFGGASKGSDPEAGSLLWSAE